ncbi:MAG TPA: type II CRISPR-associated endonuclease Cas1 [Acetobacteraceae bacterium]|nr:type II CRISPR-associated endonuclease Cas1 [Acetobacteraceae bacterium]
MAWRGVHITQPARLALGDNQLLVSRDDGDVRLPIEDVAWIVIDTPQVTLSAALISACMDAGVAIIVTDRTHTPSGLILPFHRHHRQAEIAAMQIALSAPLKKRLWQAIIQAKIVNQAAVLRACGQSPAALLAMAERVGSGDPDNTEARAARAYWPRLFPDFVRDDVNNDKRNGLLNYGYAVVRSATARALVATGLLPAFGINHASGANPFNLADDLVEPFRPFVDRVVWRLTDKGRASTGASTVVERRALASVLVDEVSLGDEVVSLLVATENAAASLVRAMTANSVALLMLPRVRA